MIQEHISRFFILTATGKGPKMPNKPERHAFQLKETKPF